MSLTGRVDKGMVTQDDTTIDDGNDNLGYLTDTDPEIRAKSIRVLRMADAFLVANGRGTCAKRQAACCHELEDDPNGGMEEDEWGGRNADEGVVAERSRSHSPRGQSRRSRSRNHSSCCHSPRSPSLGGCFQSPQPPAIPNEILDSKPPACPEALTRLEEGGLSFSNV
jgi:hypothetical protein